jgi:hypothetical protein
MATVNKDFRVKHGLIVEGTTGTINGNNILTDNDTTDALGEGTTNLYYTNQRVKDVLTGSTQTNISITEVEGDLVITAESGIEDSTTDDLDEGTTNLYFTTGRVDDVIDSKTTDDIDEGTTNLYFTDSRSRNALSGTDGISYVSESGIIGVNFGYGLEVNVENELVVDTNDIATKTYVDEVAQGLKVRGSVEAATTADLGATYDNGTSGVDATLTIPATATLTIDGWTSWSEGDGVLVKDQTNAEENGRYFVDVIGDAGTAWVLKRCIDCDTAEEIPGSFVFVQHGNTYGSTGWVATVANVDTFAVGVDDIDWVQFSGAGTYVGGTGITVDGTDISIDFTEFDLDDIDEGTTNLFYTDQKVKDVLVNSSQTNISITDEEGVLTIVAENGVDDSTTDDLNEGTTNLYFTVDRVEDVIDDTTTDAIDEGTTNLYFTDQRAITAIESVIPAFNAVEITASLQVANSIVATTAETTYTAYSFDASEYRTAKFLVKMAAGNHTEVVEILLTLDTSNNIAITEYAIVGTNGTLGVVSATYDDGDVRLTVNANNNDTNVSVYGTLLV